MVTLAYVLAILGALVLTGCAVSLAHSAAALRRQQISGAISRHPAGKKRDD